MRRTQLYLDDQLWDVLHTRASKEKTTVSELVRQAVRGCYLGNLEQRRIAMQSFVGTRTLSSMAVDSVEEVRSLRRGARLERLKDQ
jgi:hypothetical protein